ncbi:hypothetical protein [Amycolatopsis sp. NPDC021455]|uniref:hypothetical protein n=1 Tax=Amycolatopsis sp. NPDC021455 TaxID=3154901 RepID=UPI0033F1F92A
MAKKKSGSVAREPAWDPTLNEEVPRNWNAGHKPRHRLVTIGDSLTHGFQSGSVFHTDVSYPAIIAYELGWLDQFRYPRYDGYGGLPFNIELLLRELERSCGRTVDWWELPLALFRGRQFMDRVEDYWERGAGAAIPSVGTVMHNLSVYGWDLRDALELSAAKCRANLGQAKDDLFKQFVENNSERAALRVYPTTDANADMTLFDAAAALGNETDDGDAGIETLVVFLGANNALRSVIDLKVVWSGEGYNTLGGKGEYTVWRPEHFIEELKLVEEKVKQIKARHVIWCTVPHVTIVPLARGVHTKVAPGSRYFPYYTRPWISDEQFDPTRDPHITADDARAVDSAIDQYNKAITKVVRRARTDEAEPRDWYLLDTAGLLDRLAQRRYIEDPLAQPRWWKPYVLPAELRACDPPLDSRFISSDGTRRDGGGLFSLDGIHPTTVAYGILAQELINVMRIAGVEFKTPNGDPRPDPVLVDFGRLIRHDTLVNTPPAIVDSSLSIMSWADEALDVIRRSLTFDV